MRYRNSGLAFRRAVAITAIIAGAAGLAGCSSIGSRMLVDPSATGSVGNVASIGAAQTMPAPLTSPGAVAAAAAGPYLPPADIGGAGNISPIQTASISSLPAAQSGAGLNSVGVQQLPPLTSTRSTQTMSAQPALKVATAQPQPQVIATIAPSPRQATAPVQGLTHQVASGESLYVIARKYGVTTDSIVLANNLGSPDKIFVGQKITIPGVSVEPVQTQKSVTTASIASTTAPKATVVTQQPVRIASAQPIAPQTPSVAPQTQPATTGEKFRWPLAGTVIADFAASRSGIDISAQEGTAVRAAAAGTVIYTGSAVQGYGNLILLKHDNGYVSAYAHLKDITVSKGETVARGDSIGSAGMTGGVSRPQLHFELRKGATPVDPVPLLMAG